VKIFCNRGRPVADFTGETVSKTVDQARHQLQRPPAWAFDKSIIGEAVGLGAKLLVVKTRDTRRIYKVGLDYFLEHCGNLDRGFGAQQFLPLSHWTVESLDNRQTELAL